MKTSKIVYQGNLRTESTHLQSGRTIITDAPTDNNGKGEAFYLKAQKEGKGISYDEWRKANNRPTDHVTLSFTGTTLNDFGVVKSLAEGAKVITTVGAKNTKTRANGKTTSDIGGYLKDQYGDFLQPNKAETELLEKSLDTHVNQLIKNFFK